MCVSLRLVCALRCHRWPRACHDCCRRACLHGPLPSRRPSNVAYLLFVFLCCCCETARIAYVSVVSVKHRDSRDCRIIICLADRCSSFHVVLCLFALPWVQWSHIKLVWLCCVYVCDRISMLATYRCQNQRESLINRLSFLPLDERCSI